MYKRSESKDIIKRIKNKRKFIQVIIGPRQVGKTTLVKQLIDEIDIESHYISADNIPVADNNWISQQWEYARIKLREGSKEVLLVIDEIQKINNWSEVIKDEWDKDSGFNNNIKLILLGSSTLLIQKGLTESLAGRFELVYLGHWSFKEMQKAFDFDVNQYIWFGGYPGAADLINDEKRWRDYIKYSLIETTISKDILMLNKIYKPALLKQLFELGSVYSGQILSYTKMLGQLQDAGNTTTLSNYLELLDQSGMLGGINKYYIEKVRQRSSSPKFQVYNNAFLSVGSQEGFSEVRKNPKKWGRFVESSIGSHLINSGKYTGIEIYYWRYRNNEVDFVLKYKNKIIGLEVKSGNKSNTKGMKEFQNKFKPDKILLVGNKGIPWQDFLLINPVNLFD